MTLSTVHSAKGTEYDHVLLIGTWPARQDRAKLEETRRAFYVGMTRARKTLAVLDRQDIRPSLPETVAGPAVTVAESVPKAAIACSDLSATKRWASKIFTWDTLGGFGKVLQSMPRWGV